MHITARPRWFTATVLTLSAGLVAQTPAHPAAATTTAATTAATAVTTAASTAAPLKPRAADGEDRAVTLITGDRVVLVGGDLAKVRIEPGPGRRKVPFRMLRVHGGLSVIPSDVSADVLAGKLDRRLFDIDTLLEDRYDDARTASIPLIVTYTDRAERPALPNATTTRQLRAINGSAVHVAKKDAAAFLSGVRTARAAGPAKIWLDGRRTPTLDESVPQIGAPAAWQAGFTGKGVKIAVLDTGVDATHPDLSGQIAETKNFTDGPPQDENGHGTHVASTIAGTGAASGGKYRGVAPDAKLYAGKVCELSCTDSSILAAMGWAATEVHATAVNMSFGGTDTPETDPVEEAVDRLTAETGTLFVIAAGNSGPGAATIESPGSADAALTVGAVDKQDKLADFSSRGPRLGDGAIKPDVTAPGVNITAARPIGQGDPPYQSMSGTSMATPHVTGAVALLAQQHLDWHAADLKGALMTSAKQLPGLTPFEQGAGRIDVSQATPQTLTVTPASISFGTALWPHQDDAPVTKQLTYRNTGTQPVTLQLATNLTGPDGKPAPTEALRLSAGTLTVPAGGTASVGITSDTRHDGPDGTYSGQLTATGPSAALTTTIALTKEVESYDLTVHLIGPEGQPADGSLFVNGLDNDFSAFVPVTSGTLTRRVPKGRYLVDGFQWYPQGDRSPVYEMVSPNTTVAAATAVTFDARTAKPYDVTVPEPDAAPLLTEVHYELAGAAGLDSSIIAYRPQDLYTAQVGKPLPAGQMTGWLASSWVKFDSAGSWDESPFLYHTMDPTTGFPTGLTRRIRPGELAVVDQQVYRASNPRAAITVFGSVAGSRAWTTEQLPPVYTLPSERKVYVDGGSAVWSTAVDELGARWASSVISSSTGYRAGHSYRQRLNVAAFAPTPDTVKRSDDVLSVEIYPTSDATGAAGETMTDTESTKLLADGRLIAETATFGKLAVSGLPAGKTQYVLESDLTRPSYSSYSTHVTGRWSFSSSAGQKAPPLLGVRYQPAVDVNNTVARTPVTQLPVTVVAQSDASAPTLRRASLQYSSDGGATWHDATLRQTARTRYLAIFPTPKDGDAVSLKAKLTDRSGNTSELTTIGAYRFR